ncbi:MAG: 5-(carboxyamino)imidazole ribonucleotide synthase [Spirochaetaceae bacterium]|nr:MAG: 5-(carboxyamino)imidazole ribonucleotide synthase [Spirochaetaceae bacterium]
MMLPAARRLGVRLVVLDPAEDAPAAAGADLFLQGDLYDEKVLRRLAEAADILTFEIEHTSTEALAVLEAEGTVIRPSATVLRCIQDKLTQKQLLSDAGLPVPRFAAIPDPLRFDPTAQGFAYPCVWKARFGGYDGRGVRVLRNACDGEALRAGSSVPADAVAPATASVTASAMIEEAVDIEAEFAVLVARDLTGEVLSYPPLRMRFHDEANVLDVVELPSELDPTELNELCRVAEEAVRVLNGVGLFAVELFLTSGGSVLINEIAPRPHNSGHLTIEACYTDQFEQHLRAVCGLPLGSVTVKAPAVMCNLLGHETAVGTPYLSGAQDALRIPGVNLHWYGKSEVRPGRKMGHITAVAPELDDARERCRAAEALVKVYGSAQEDIA